MDVVAIPRVDLLLARIVAVITTILPCALCLPTILLRDTPQMRRILLLPPPSHASPLTSPDLAFARAGSVPISRPSPLRGLLHLAPSISASDPLEITPAITRILILVHLFTWLPL